MRIDDDFFAIFMATFLVLLIVLGGIALKTYDQNHSKCEEGKFINGD